MFCRAQRPIFKNSHAQEVTRSEVLIKMYLDVGERGETFLQDFRKLVPDGQIAYYALWVVWGEAWETGIIVGATNETTQVNISQITFQKKPSGAPHQRSTTFHFSSFMLRVSSDEDSPSCRFMRHVLSRRVDVLLFNLTHYSVQIR